MRFFTLLLLVVFAATFTACLEDESSLLSPGAESTPTIDQYNRTPAQPSDLVGQNFSMADISLSATGELTQNFSMSACYLALLDDDCNADCQSRLDEDGSFLNFTNSYVDLPGTEYDGVSFRAIDGEQGQGWNADFLRSEVLPLLTGAEWRVERQGNDFILSCTDCEMNRYGNTFANRTITLRR